MKDKSHLVSKIFIQAITNFGDLIISTSQYLTLLQPQVPRGEPSCVLR